MKFLVIIIFLSYSIWAKPISQGHVDTVETIKLKPIVYDVYTDIVNQNYTQAHSLLKSKGINRSDSLFLAVVIEGARISDYESYALDGRKLLRLCDSARSAFTDLDVYNRDLYLFYYLGTIEAIAAVVRGKRNDFVGALTGSNVSKKNLSIAISRDSTFLPAYFGVATRDYYSARAMSKIGLAKKKASNNS